MGSPLKEALSTSILLILETDHQSREFNDVPRINYVTMSRFEKYKI